MKDVLLEFDMRPRNIVRGEDGRLRFEGVVVFENAMSGNGRFYPSEFIDASIVKTEDWLAQGHITTIHRSHEAWMKGDLPIGKAMNLRHEGNKMVFDAQISATRDGSDMMVLVEDEVMARMSMRSTQSEGEYMPIEGAERDIIMMEWAVIEGIDFCERPGITGAGITKILESAPIKKETNMEWNEITLEDVRTERPDLLEGYLAETFGAFLAERDELREQVSTLTTQAEELRAQIVDAEAEEDHSVEVDALTEQRDSLLAEMEQAKWTLTRYEAAAPKWLAGLVEDLAECDPEALLEEVGKRRDSIIASFVSEAQPKGKGEHVESPPTPTLEENSILNERVLRNSR